MAVNAAPVFPAGTKARALQVNGGFDTSGAFLGITCTVEITLGDGSRFQADWPLAAYLPVDFLMAAQQDVPSAVRDLVAARGCEYG